MLFLWTYSTETYWTNIVPYVRIDFVNPLRNQNHSHRSAHMLTFVIVFCTNNFDLLRFATKSADGVSIIAKNWRTPRRWTRTTIQFLSNYLNQKFLIKPSKTFHFFKPLWIVYNSLCLLNQLLRFNQLSLHKKRWTNVSLNFQLLLHSTQPHLDRNHLPLFLMPPQTVSGEMLMQLFSCNVTNGSNPSETEVYRFCQNYGFYPSIFSAIWRRIAPNIPGGALRMHLSWAMRLLSSYCIETINADAMRCSKKTFRKWRWEFIWCMSDLDVVRLLYLLSVVCALFCDCPGTIIYSFSIASGVLGEQI